MDFTGENLEAILEKMRTRMLAAASNLEFEEAARLRDDIERLKQSADAPYTTKRKQR